MRAKGSGWADTVWTKVPAEVLSELLVLCISDLREAKSAQVQVAEVLQVPS